MVFAMTYGEQAEAFLKAEAENDGKVYAHMYEMSIKALLSLDENPETLVRIAMNRQLDEYGAIMTEIGERLNPDWYLRAPEEKIVYTENAGGSWYDC